MKLGVDISRWNNQHDIPYGTEFLIMKATEGATHVDPALSTHLASIGMESKERGVYPIIGFYHYARPRTNNPEEEARHFLDTIEQHVGSCLMALDWEEPNTLKEWSTQKQEKWAQKFIDFVKNKTGVDVLFYTSRYVAKSFINRCPGFLNNRLWLADYNGKFVKKINGVPVIMQQIANKPYDIDIFYGSHTDMVKWAIGKNDRCK